MTTAIIGVGNIGRAVARHLVAGGEPVVLAAKEGSNAEALADEEMHARLEAGLIDSFPASAQFSFLMSVMMTA